MSSSRSPSHVLSPQPFRPPPLAHPAFFALQCKTTLAASHGRSGHLPGQLLIRIRPDALTSGASTATSLPSAVAGPLEFLRRIAGLKSVTPLFSRRADKVRTNVGADERHRRAILASVTDAPSDDLRGINLVELDPRVRPSSVARRLRDAAAIEFVEPVPRRRAAGRVVLDPGAITKSGRARTRDDRDHRRHERDDRFRTRRAKLDPTGAPGRRSRVRAAFHDRRRPLAVVADPRRNLQWGLRRIRWFDCGLPSAADVSVGVLDSGVDASHHDLASARIDLRCDGLKPADLLGHGTHVAGIISGARNDEAGVCGVARCPLVMWKVFPDSPDRDGEFYVDARRYLRALNDAILSGVRILNLSIAGALSSKTEQLLFRRLESAGILAIAAMGNEFESGNPVQYPAAHSGVLAVGALAENNRRCTFSNTGDHLSLLAPGANILSTAPVEASPHFDDAEYAVWSGTSMSAAYVTAAAALLSAKHPDWAASDVRRRLCEPAAPLPEMSPHPWTPAHGAGCLNLSAALTEP